MAENLPVLERTPYNESGNPLSFRTSANTIYMDDGRTLQEYLEAAIANVSGGSAGRGISKTETYYAVFPREYTSVEQVKNSSNGSGWRLNSSPNCTNDFPMLWKKTVTYYTDSTTQTLYEFCGSLGQDGIDGPGSEWVYKGSSKKLTPSELQSVHNGENTVRYQRDDYVPAGWEDDCPSLGTDLGNNNVVKFQYQSRRKKVDGVWGAFSTPHLIGQLPDDADGVITNNIFASGDSAPDLPNIDFLTCVDGKIRGLVDGNWKDSIPNEWNTATVWMAICYFSLSTGQCFRIENPIKITGEAGVGSDGKGIEFAYYTTDEEILSEFPMNDLISWGPTHFTGSGLWSDHPIAVSKDQRYQYASVRTGHYTSPTDWEWGGFNQDTYKSVSNYNYGWSNPVPWSMWGQDGIDGDGVQYVYVRLTEAEYLFVKNHPERWNFDGGLLDEDGNFIEGSIPDTPGGKPNSRDDNTSDNSGGGSGSGSGTGNGSGSGTGSGSGSGNNTGTGGSQQTEQYKYYYELDSTYLNYNYTPNIGAEDTKVEFYVSGYYVKATSAGVTVEKTRISSDKVTVYLDNSTYNTSETQTKSVSQEFTWHDLVGKVNITRNPNLSNIWTYHIYYRDSGMQPMSGHPDVTGTLQKGQTLPVTAPDIDGYEHEGATSYVLSETIPSITFRYKLPGSTVVETEVTSISLNKSTVSINVGKSEQLTYTISPTSAETNVTFSSSDSNTVMVTQQGLITGVTFGNATITATTTNGKTATCTVTVI